MTKNASFKARVRTRMERTGERYAAARRVLIEQAAGGTADAGHDTDAGPATAPAWVSQPEMTDDAVRAATGRGWDEWVALIEAESVADDGHTAVARWVRDAHGIDGWWAQTVVVGWERITGRRLPGQMADGTYTVGRSRTMAIDREQLRAALVDEEGLAALFPSMDVTPRSRPTTKSPRVAMPEGVAVIGFDELDDGRVRVDVAHQRLPSPAAMDLWRDFWADWLTALAEA